MFQAIMMEFMATWKNEKRFHQQVARTDGTHFMSIDDY